MSTIVTRAGKGSPLTHNEVDANFNNLNNDKYQSGSSPSFAGTTLSSGNLTFSSTGQRITGDMSNATWANRLAVQTSTTNGNTNFTLLPNGTGTASQVVISNSSDTANNSYLGLVQVGTTDSRIQAGIQGTGSYTPITFYTGGSERMRLDTSGNLGIGTASPTGRLNVSRADNAEGARIQNTLSTGLTSDIFQIAAFSHAAGTGFYFERFYSSGPTVQFAVRGDGTIYAQNTTVQSLSDARVKENVRTATEGLAVIDALRPVRFDFKEGFGNNRKNQLGFVAQEVEAVFPDAVDVMGDKDENGDSYKSVGPAALIPVLVKAIQELSAKVAALEAK